MQNWIILPNENPIDNKLKNPPNPFRLGSISTMLEAFGNSRTLLNTNATRFVNNDFLILNFILFIDQYMNSFSLIFDFTIANICSDFHSCSVWISTTQAPSCLALFRYTY